MDQNGSARELGVGLIGSGFMGRAHALAFRAVGGVFDLPIALRLEMIGGALGAGCGSVGNKGRVCQPAPGSFDGLHRQSRGDRSKRFKLGLCVSEIDV